VRVLPVTGQNTTEWLWVAVGLMFAGIAASVGGALRRRN
jgi:LPXTG-motif cell wall-anchored protein